MINGLPTLASIGVQETIPSPLRRFEQCLVQIIGWIDYLESLVANGSLSLAGTKLRLNSFP